MGPLVVAGEEVVLATDGDDSERSFGDIVVEAELGVVEEGDEAFPLVGRVADGVAQRAFGRVLGRLGVEPFLPT